ncbi:hypothetical protein OG523_02225 [Streptomyces virginiae]|uniref:hypothetical protein n=1 Tax=Streptomyces virginiae TaxID=1961 RepID=UPI002E33E364|nr:hypothetical protein [Streptomyces virginiae]
MSIRKRLTVSAAVLALAGAGLVAAPEVASAAPAQISAIDCKANNLTGSLGHKGKEIWCTGTSSYYRGAIVCKKVDDGSNREYTHYGPTVGPGAKSTVWCDYGAIVRFWYTIS